MFDVRTARVDVAGLAVQADRVAFRQCVFAQRDAAAGDAEAGRVGRGQQRRVVAESQAWRFDGVQIQPRKQRPIG